MTRKKFKNSHKKQKKNLKTKKNLKNKYVLNITWVHFNALLDTNLIRTYRKAIP